jgi:uncharacterized membrane protein YGL010W
MSTMSPVLKTQFADYASFHKTSGNQACHYVGIPLIVLTVFSFLGALPIARIGGFDLTLAEVALLTVTLYYLSLDLGLGLLMLLVSVVLDALGRALPLGLALALFLFGWALQFLGHYRYEKKSPAFFQNLTHLLVGPLWILAKATRRA